MIEGLLELGIQERATGIVVARFTHEKEEFSVFKEGQERVVLNVADKGNITYGVIRGSWVEIAEAVDFGIHWIGYRDIPLRVPRLLGTALGEVVAQSRDMQGMPLIFRASDRSVTEPFKKMFGYLQQDPRFSGRIIAGQSHHFPGLDYVVQPV